jgi:colicin import membrane protein
MQRERELEEAARQAEQERLAAAMEAKQAALAAAERRRREAELSALQATWGGAIRAKIERLWRKPATASPGDSCIVRVSQTSGGYIETVDVTRCTGDEDFRSSVEAAVYKADPLPPAPTPEVFESQLEFTFVPEG